MEYIREFYTVAKENSFSKAADKLFMSESTVSRHIQKLERSLNTALLYRDTHSVRLTQAGELLYRYAETIVQAEDEFSSAFSRMKNTDDQAVTCIIQHAAVKYGVIRTLQNIQKKYPQIILKTESGKSGADYLTLLKQNSYDFAIIAETALRSDRSFQRRPLIYDPLVLLVPKKHRLARRESAELADIVKYPLILPRETTPTYRLFMEALRKSHLQPGQITIGYPTESVVDMAVIAGQCAVVPKAYIESKSIPELTVLPIVPEILYHINLVFLPDAKPSVIDITKEMKKLYSSYKK